MILEESRVSNQVIRVERLQTLLMNKYVPEGRDMRSLSKSRSIRKLLLIETAI